MHMVIQFNFTSITLVAQLNDSHTLWYSLDCQTCGWGMSCSLSGVFIFCGIE